VCEFAHNGKQNRGFPVIKIFKKPCKYSEPVYCIISWSLSGKETTVGKNTLKYY
jgi:hypothetical protein